MKFRLICMSLCLGLASCGYQPLYGTAGTQGPITHQLASISVDQQNTRTGQLVRNELVSSLGSARSGGTKQYRLSIHPTSSDDDTVKTFGSDIVRKSYQLSVKYTLSDTSSGKVVHRGNTFAHVSYDRTAAPFSDYQARINAEERAAKEVGNDIHTRLAAYFSSRR